MKKHTSTYSILRREENRVLGALTFTGRVLDLGGHQSSSYLRAIQSVRPIEIANFDAHTPGVHKSPSGATHVFDFEKPFPLGDASFDAVLIVNVLEHIFNYTHVLTEVNRILVPGGTVHITVPFFFNIHSSPNDYFRYTRAALEKIMGNQGYTAVTIQELGFGPATALFQNFGGSIPTQTLRIFFMHVAIMLDKSFSLLSKKYAAIRNRVPLGYVVHAQKPHASV